jgi:heptosyltransferase-2
MSAGRNILIVGVNWIGDAIMSMPGVQAFRRAHPHDRITLLVKPGLRDVWAAHPAIDDILLLEKGGAGTWHAAKRIREAAPAFDVAYVLPNSFRSAFIPYLARVPQRIGYAGQMRAWMLTDRRAHARQVHQVFETYDLLVPEARIEQWEAPALHLETAPADELRIALLPGAARGPAKQWPEAHYVAVARKLAAALDARFWVLGTGAEQALCDRVASSIGPAASSLAGRTTFEEWMHYLKRSALVLCNDSGGMHMAAALGRPLVVFFGLTDPGRTGPLSPHVRILQKVHPQGRDIPRVSTAAAAALAAITPEEAFEAAQDLLKELE